MSQVMGSTVLEFLTCLADSTNRALTKVNTHYAALVDPLHFRLNITVPSRALKLLQSGI